MFSLVTPEGQIPHHKWISSCLETLSVPHVRIHWLEYRGNHNLLLQIQHSLNITHQRCWACRDCLIAVVSPVRTVPCCCLYHVMSCALNSGRIKWHRVESLRIVRPWKSHVTDEPCRDRAVTRYRVRAFHWLTSELAQRISSIDISSCFESRRGSVVSHFVLSGRAAPCHIMWCLGVLRLLMSCRASHRFALCCVVFCRIALYRVLSCGVVHRIVLHCVVSRNVVPRVLSCHVASSFLYFCFFIYLDI